MHYLALLAALISLTAATPFPPHFQPPRLPCPTDPATPPEPEQYFSLPTPEPKSEPEKGKFCTRICATEPIKECGEGWSSEISGPQVS